MVLGAWCLVLGAWYLVLSTWQLALTDSELESSLITDWFFLPTSQRVKSTASFLLND